MWGPWALGMAAANPRVAARFAAAGLSLLTPPQGIKLLERAISHQSSYTNIVAAHISWPKLLSAARKDVPRIFSAFETEVQHKIGGSFGSLELSTAAKPELAPEAIAQKVAEIVEAMLGVRIAFDQVSGFFPC